MLETYIRCDLSQVLFCLDFCLFLLSTYSIHSVSVYVQSNI